MARVKGEKMLWLVLLAICISWNNGVSARKWNTNKDSVIVDAQYADGEEGELHFDALDQPDNVECLTLDHEPGICVTLRRCHPILFGEKGELRNPSLAEDYSKNVDTCQSQNAVDDETSRDEEPVPVPTKSKLGEKILCCAKEKVQITHRSSLEVSDDEQMMYQTTSAPDAGAAPLNNDNAEDQEQVTQSQPQTEELLILDLENEGQQFQPSSSESPVGSTGIPEVEEVVYQAQNQQQQQPQQPEGGQGEGEEENVPSPPQEQGQEQEQPQASPSPEVEIPEPPSPPQGNEEEAVQLVNENSNVVPLAPEEPAVVAVVPAEEDVQQVVEPEAESNDLAGGCSPVTLYNTWPAFENYPFLAAIQTRSNSGPICSGSLIDARHILTGAHCLHRFNSRDVARMQVRIGFSKNRANDTFNDYYLERKASKVIFHKRFHEQSKMDNNIALVQLDQPVEFDEHVSPIEIFDGARGYDQGQCAGVEAGWIKYGNRKVTGASGGVISYIEPPMSDFVLREAINKIYTNADCQSYLYSEITDHMLCAKTNMFEAHGVTTDHFRGNDGGPLIIRVGDKVQQVGIKSWAYEGNQYPTVYTRVDRYLDWIRNNLEM